MCERLLKRMSMSIAVNDVYRLHGSHLPTIKQTLSSTRFFSAIFKTVIVIVRRFVLARKVALSMHRSYNRKYLRNFLIYYVANQNMKILIIRIDFNLLTTKMAHIHRFGSDGSSKWLINLCDFHNQYSFSPALET